MCRFSVYGRGAALYVQASRPKKRRAVFYLLTVLNFRPPDAAESGWLFGVNRRTMHVRTYRTLMFLAVIALLASWLSYASLRSGDQTENPNFVTVNTPIKEVE